MAASDLKYFSADQSNRILVEVKSDAGAWVDLNSLAPAGFPDYAAGLLSRPSVTIAADRQDGVYAATVDAITMDNAPFAGGKMGFWDLPFPVRIKRGATTHVFSGWQSRWLRLGLRCYLPDGTYYDHYYPAFIIEEHPTTGSGRATIKLASLFRILQRRSAETIKIGTDWARGWPIKALMKLLASRTDRNLTFATGSDTGTVDLGVADVARCSSWGSAPGILTTGEQAVEHWIPKCMCTDTSSPSLVYVGFAVPGARDTEDAGLASFNLGTGQWTIIVNPSVTAAFQSGFPVEIHMADGFLWVACVKNIAPTNYSFYNLAWYRVSTAGAVVSLPSGYGYWPARETLRGGVGSAGGGAVAGDAGVSTPAPWSYSGESLMLPFPQALDCLCGDMTGLTVTARGIFSSYKQGDAGDSDTGQVQDLPLHLSGACYAAYGYAGSTVYKAGFRYFMGTQWHRPYRIVRAGTPNVAYNYWVGLEPGTKNFYLYRWKEATGTAEVWTHPLTSALGAGGNQLWAAQVTAWASAPNFLSSDATDKVLVAWCEWDETAAASVRWSATKIACIAFTGGDGTVAHTKSTITIDDPTDGAASEYARTIVGLWTPPTGTAPTNAQEQTDTYAVAVVCNRSTLQRPCYGIGIFNCVMGVTLTKLDMFGDSGYAGPTSSMPFAGFTRSYEGGLAKIFYFTDQANGQVWKCDCTGTPVWTLCNKGQAAHQTEHAVATVHGLTASVGGYETVLWGMAPGPGGEVTFGYPLRAQCKPSQVRHMPGLYPLIQFSQVLSDAIEVAEFSGMKAFDAMVALRQCAWDYRLFIDGDNAINFRKFTTGAPVAQLVLTDQHPVPDLLAAVPEIGVRSTCKRRLLPVKNAVDIVPWGMTEAGQAKVTTVKATGSNWGGDYLVNVATEKPMRLAITCVVGGNVLANSATTDPAKVPVLWAWSRIAETAHCYLAVMCGATDTTVKVGGVTTRGSDVYAGDARVRVGDWVRVSDGDLRQITAFGTMTDGYVSMSLSGAIGVASLAYSEVTIEPHDRYLSSVSDSGITTVTVAFDPNGSPLGALRVADASQILAGMVVRTRAYLWLVEKVTRNASDWSLTVSSLYFTGTKPDASIPIGEKLSAYIYTKTPGVSYPVSDTGVTFGVATVQDAEDPSVNVVSPGDGLIVDCPGMKLGEIKGSTIRKVDRLSIGDEDQGNGYGRCDVSINDNRFIDTLRADRIGDKVLVDAWPRIELTDATVEAIWPVLEIGAEVSCSDPRVVPVDSSGIEQSMSFHVVGKRANLADCTETITFRSALATPAGKRDDDVTPTVGTAMPTGRRGEE